MNCIYKPMVGEWDWLEINMAKRLSNEEMIQIVDDILDPKEFTSEELNQRLLLFALNCPDPVAAMDLIIQTQGPITAEGLVARALAYSPRDPNSLPESQLALTHPLRYMSLDP